MKIKFEKVFVLSLPSRSDKRDAFAIQASLTGFDYHMRDGVDPTTISPKALPPVSCGRSSSCRERT